MYWITLSISFFINQSVTFAACAQQLLQHLATLPTTHIKMYQCGLNKYTAKKKKESLCVQFWHDQSTPVIEGCSLGKFATVCSSFLLTLTATWVEPFPGCFFFHLCHGCFFFKFKSKLVLDWAQSSAAELWLVQGKGQVKLLSPRVPCIHLHHSHSGPGPAEPALPRQGLQ